MGLIPVVDLLNHHCGAKEARLGYDLLADCITFRADFALEAGQEACFNYGGKKGGKEVPLVKRIFQTVSLRPL